VVNVRVLGFSRLDGLDLKEQFPDAVITYEPAPASNEQHGELLTVALIALTIAGLNVLAAWLLKDRKGTRIKKTLELEKPDGTRRVEEFSMDVTSSTSQADVVKALAALTQFDQKLLPGTQ
jgi:hypothetical protein